MNEKLRHTPEQKMGDGENEPILSLAEKNRWFSTLRTRNFSEKTRYMSTLAREKGVTSEEILRELRKHAKSKINHPDKVKHFHRTGFENFEQIADKGALLSRSEIQRRNPGTRIKHWSASNSAMMTQDKYDQDGKLITPGLTKDTHGASGGGITFVFSPEIMEQESYDALSSYPTIDYAPLDQTVEAVLVDNPKDISRIEKALLDRDLKDILVLTKDQWLSDRMSKK